MRERIDITEALRLYQILRNWSEVARRLARSTTMPFCPDAVQKAVREYDLGRRA